MTKLKVYILLIFILLPEGRILGQTKTDLFSKPHYLGILPSVLVEPYDTVNAVEVNILPFTYEYRLDLTTAIQIRPLVNYRFLKNGNGISHLGGTMLINKYLPAILKSEVVTPMLGVFTTYTYNRLDNVHTFILGIEPGVFFSLSERLSLSAALQPGIDFFPDRYSQEFVKAKDGYLPHFGFILHIGLTLE